MCGKTNRFCDVEWVVSDGRAEGMAQTEAVRHGEDEKESARRAHQGRVLETWRQVGVGRVHRQLVILWGNKIKI